MFRGPKDIYLIEWSNTMKCDVCKKEEAIIHIQEVANNNIKAIHLCEECARSYGIKGNIMNLGFTLIDIFSNMTSGKLLSKQSKPSGSKDELIIPQQDNLKCPVCNETFSEFIETAKLGCGYCYIAFHDRIKPLLRKIHSQSLHKGKVPKNMQEKVSLNKALRSLNNRLKISLKREDYEKAALLRDEIKKLNEKMGE
ncbi:MAG: UvrB/UvrC motif-containing protein [Spirochaetes bacterium]|nr:UvrB/UvrC motif-containing protein [Spirochaetota bacterium]